MKTAFDVDTGVDDSLALLYALNKPQFEIVGIATVTGNVEADLAAENTLKILDLAGAPEIPVTVGALRPLGGRWEGRVSVIHGDNGLGNVKLPASGRKTTGKGAEVDYLKEAFKHYRHGNQVQNYCIDDSPLHDPLAVMCAAVPSLVHIQMRKARVECGGTYCRGMIVTDLREHPFQAEYIRFATAVDEERALGELLSAFLEEGR